MGFGGKNRKATGKRPGIPHHPRAQWSRHVQRCTWERLQLTLDGAMGGLSAFEVMRKAGEEAINNLMLGITQTMGLDAAMAPRRATDVPWSQVTGRLEEVMLEAISAATIHTTPGPWFSHPDTGRRFRVAKIVRRDDMDVAEIEWEVTSQTP